MMMGYNQYNTVSDSEFVWLGDSAVGWAVAAWAGLNFWGFETKTYFQKTERARKDE